jgi:Fungal specific transcription factor domain/Fungal Zn(2)-Cys(6) binuclear cluster domain
MVSPRALSHGGSELAINFDSGAGLPQPKRRKTTIACELCRVRKSKCDGVRPTCGPCSKRKATIESCTYAEGKSRNRREFSQSELDPAIDYQSPPHEASTSRQTSQYAPRTSSKASTLPSTHHEFSLSPRNAIHPSPTRPTPSTSPYSLTPAVGTGQETFPQGGINMRPETDAMGNIDNWAVRVGLFGASSSASFMQHVSNIVDGTKPPDPDFKARGAASGHASTRPFHTMPAKSGNLHSREFVLPPRRTANLLLEIHWNCSQIIFPWVDRIRFMRQYEALWSDHEDLAPFLDEQVFYCILNIIFALSYKIDPNIDPEEQERLSDAHFSRAQSLLSFNLLEISHIGMVQALLLLAQYLQSTNMPRQCFQCVSLAIWIAQDIGLNVPETILPFQSQREREIARRLWHGCILMDRVTAMTFGRPTRISQEVAKMSPLPSAIDDEFLDGIGSEEGVQPADQPSQLDFFIAYCELHIILGDILSFFYTSRMQPGHGAPNEQFPKENLAGDEHVDKLLQLEKALELWRGKLKPHHQIDHDFQDQPIVPVFRRQAISLRARFLHIRILLYRPFFSKPPPTSGSSSAPSSFPQPHQLVDAISSHGLVACVQAAQQLIQLISTHLDSEANSVLLPPWWHVISYTYTAGTVVIAAHLFQLVVDQVSLPALSTAAHQALSILQHFEVGRKSVRQCKSALESLYEKASGSRPGRQSPGEAYISLDTGGQTGTAEVELPADFFHHNGSLDFYDGTELLWLNSAPFNPDMSIWL